MVEDAATTRRQVARVDHKSVSVNVYFPSCTRVVCIIGFREEGEIEAAAASRPVVLTSGAVHPISAMLAAGTREEWMQSGRICQLRGRALARKR